MLTCPRCRIPLKGVSTRLGPRSFACPSCAGRAVTIEALRPYVPPARLSALWTDTRAGGDDSGQACPGCGKAMQAVRSDGTEGRVDLDSCPGCRLVWFDPTEVGRFAIPRDRVAERESEEEARRQRERDLPLEARVLLAKAEAERIAARGSPDLLGDAVTDSPQEPWQWLPATLGLPIEVDRPSRMHVAWATWITAAIVFLPALFALGNTQLSVAALGLLPSDPWRAGGLTWLSSLVIHGGLGHLLGNSYFLLLAGDDVEDVLGPARWVALFLLAGLAGNLAHVLFDPRPNIPLVGASGSISGLLAFYALRFPGARMALVFRLFYRFAFLKIPVAVVAVFWLLLQIVGAVAQRDGCTRVSAFAHLGGIAVGVAFWGWSHRFPGRT
jgi:membrane associated rhomboid family serine protease